MFLLKTVMPFYSSFSHSCPLPILYRFFIRKRHGKPFAVPGENEGKAPGPGLKNLVQYAKNILKCCQARMPLAARGCSVEEILSWLR